MSKKRPRPLLAWSWSWSCILLPLSHPFAAVSCIHLHLQFCMCFSSVNIVVVVIIGCWTLGEEGGLRVEDGVVSCTCWCVTLLFFFPPIFIFLFCGGVSLFFLNIYFFYFVRFCFWLYFLHNFNGFFRRCACVIYTHLYMYVYEYNCMCVCAACFTLCTWARFFAVFYGHFIFFWFFFLAFCSFLLIMMSIFLFKQIITFK